MTRDDFFNELTEKFRKIVYTNDLLDEEIEVTGKVLTPEEAIGRPDREDFPILTGKERLMEATFRNSKGQAFTDMPGGFSGTIIDIVKRPLRTSNDRAILIATINAVCCSLGLCKNTVHCKYNDPEECAMELSSFLRNKYSGAKIAIVGYQPSMLEKLSGDFRVRNLDLDSDKVGSVKFGITVEHGINNMKSVLDWADIIVATGSTVVNGTIVNYITEKPCYFFGTTISGTASLMGLNRFCSKSA